MADKALLGKLLLLFLCGGFPNFSLGQPLFSPLSTLSNTQPIQNQEQRLEQQRRSLEQEQRDRSRKRQLENPQSKPKLLSGPCFDISHVQFEGNTLFSDAYLLELIEPFLGECLNASDVEYLLNTVSGHYFNHGYVTSRAYFPEQNIESGQLLIKIVEGVIEGVVENVTSNEHEIFDNQIFPIKKKQILNLRDLEQGLENINRLQSHRASLRLLPGSDLGQTKVEISTDQDTPLSFRLGTDNSGSEDTGKNQLQSFIGWDDALGLYDFSYLSYQTDRDFGDKHHYSRSLIWHWDVPLGYWSVAVDYSRFEFMQQVAGNYVTFQSSGTSETHQLSLSRVLYRDQYRKAKALFGITQKQTRNYIEDVLLNVSSRDVVLAEVGLLCEYYFRSGAFLLADVRYSASVNDFGADKTALSNFEYITAFFDYRHPYVWQEQKFQYQSQWKVRYSPDPLYGTEQFSIGSDYTVRGFKDDSLSGNSGSYWRNDLYWQITPFDGSNIIQQITPFVGFDIGVVKSHQRSLTDRQLKSVSIGTKASGKHWSAEFSYSKPIDKPTDFNHTQEEYMFRVSLFF